MKNLILRRGGGKTTRLLAMSEFHNAPIICVDGAHKQQVLDMARRHGYIIPAPATVQELVNGKFYADSVYRDFLVDESQDVLCALVSALTRTGRVIGMTTTDERISFRR